MSSAVALPNLSSELHYHLPPMWPN